MSGMGGVRRRAVPPDPAQNPPTLRPAAPVQQRDKGGGPLHSLPGHPGWVLAGGWDGATWVILGTSSSWSPPGVLLQCRGSRDRSLVSALHPIPCCPPGSRAQAFNSAQSPSQCHGSGVFKADSSHTAPEVRGGSARQLLSCISPHLM